MKLQQDVLEVTRSGDFKERGFTIAGNAKAFDILSSKIYTDIPLAIVRELSTNASDSHTDAGCPELPFDVHLPNSLEPWFTIRDYGTGLSPENVENVYTTYFKSTRSNSDDFTGCLGLGSKSPFAYTDQFTIVSNWNGRKYTYSAFKNEASCPSLALLSDVEANESNGLEIRIPVNGYDASKFVDAARKVYTYFKVRPIVTGATLIIEDKTPLLATADFVIYDRDRAAYQYNANISVVMGQVRYTVDYSKINVRGIGNDAHIILYMPIGSCSIAASREEIHYDQNTINNVNKALKNAIEISSKEFENRVATEKCVLDKLRSLSKYRSIITGLSVSGKSQIDTTEKGKYAAKDCMVRKGDKLFINQYAYHFDGTESREYAFIEEDIELTQQIKNKLRQYVVLNQAKKHCYLVKVDDQARFKELFGDFDNKLSTLPDVPRAPRDTSRATSRSKPIKILKMNRTDNLNFEWDNIHTATDVDNKNACCVPRDGNWAIWEGQRIRPNEIREIAEALGFERIYGISEKRYDSLRIKYGIESLSDVAKVKAEKLVKGLDSYAIARFINKSGYLHSNFQFNKLKGLSTECDDLIKMYSAKTDNMDVYQKLCKIFNITMPTAPDYQEAFFKKYPILLAIEWYGGYNVMQLVTDYVKMVEAS